MALPNCESHLEGLNAGSKYHFNPLCLHAR
jgi:hypothetical protein